MTTLEQLQNLPQYRSHKIIRAAKILEVQLHGDRSAELVLEGTALGSITVDAAYVDKHKPQAGGYFVLYDDGYQSWSPAKAFEEGYTRTDPDRNYR